MSIQWNREIPGSKAVKAMFIGAGSLLALSATALLFDRGVARVLFLIALLLAMCAVRVSTATRD
jgi:hypothetical protein